MSSLILYNGKIFTQDNQTASASALGIQSGRIQSIGTDAEVMDTARLGTKKIDLEGHRVLPGFTDAHFHFYEWALLQHGLALEHETSKNGVLERVRAESESKPPGEWIIGQGWNQDRWRTPQLPDRLALDRVAPLHPVILWRTDLHLAWVNSRALMAAGIDAHTPDPPMGVVDRDISGNPTGILRELAINLVREVMPAYTLDETAAAMRRSMSTIHRLGLTGVHDFRIMGGADGPPALRAWQRLRSRDELDLRAWVMLPGELLDQAIALGLQSGFGDEFLRLGAIKLFADGATGARTAWMLEPFSDGGSGLPLTPMEEIAEKVSRAHQAGIATGIHAIGDRAVRELLDVHTEIGARQTGSSSPGVPHRIEHAQHSQPEDLIRLAPLGLVASVQPLHLSDDIEMIDHACGARGRWAYAFRTLLDSGTVLAMGSDCPVASPNPFWGIHAAVTRQRLDGSPPGGWYPEQRLTLEEAIRGYTLGPAYASGQTAQQGSLSPGKLADLIVLDRDIFNVPADEIREIKVVMTVFNGRVVYRTRM